SRRGLGYHKDGAAGIGGTNIWCCSLIMNYQPGRMSPNGAKAAIAVFAFHVTYKYYSQSYTAGK
ncbi:MAG: hypothetical protein M0003_12520, partial [Acidithiobacillus sp.]|nr:hypothetical protein [Acidithiobacillus sp.]